MKMDVYHCFGSRWFCLQMQNAFDEQSRILSRILQLQDAPTLQSILPLACAIESNARALALMRVDNHLNEAHVLMRMLTERVINLCFLVATEPTKSENLAGAETATGESAVKTQSTEELIEAAKVFRLNEVYDSDALDEKLRIIGERTGTPEELLRLAVAAHYPHASHAMSGSVFGAVCHLKPKAKEDILTYFLQEFSTLLFSGSLLLHCAIRILGKKLNASELVLKSKELSKKSTALMERIKEPVESRIQDSNGCWQSLDDLEHIATKSLKEQLGGLEAAFEFCLEAGIQVATLAHPNRGRLRLKISALFLKRVLNDLRSLWLMLNMGYTSQAASIAASLFENSLAVQCIAASDALAQTLKNKASGELPWTIAEMCRMVLKNEQPASKSSQDQNHWEILYSHYVWLCSIKHPTLAQAIHDSGAAADGKGSYAIMALPDTRKEDSDVKSLVCFVALQAAISAVQGFQKGAGVEVESDQGRSFLEKTAKVHKILTENIKAKPRLNIPFTINNSSWAQERRKKALKAQKIKNAK